ncbi:dethiobiotin synthase [Sorangium cellulosum]|uniref:ATP-dependent dethiobiotin synthetase BioD n=1 Tax=Sorangium cellulosum TaxID=56 RepID=A0A150PMY3_SORCE|nr:dethiobiotin synthase [Sorangium cellulosum]
MRRRPVSRETGQLRVAVVGTGTGVGKTHASVAMVAALAARGTQISGLKPIESGVDGTSMTDAAQLAAVSSARPEPAPYCFADPVSPHLAARRCGLAISLDVAAAWVARQPAPVVVVESAGALLSPLGPGLTNADLVRALAPDALVLVGLDRLGILHEVACCMLALRAVAPGLPPALVVLNPPAAPDASTGTNAAELESLGVTSGAVAMPRGASTSPALLAAAQLVWTRLGF